jgi:hypothetical protein
MATRPAREGFYAKFEREVDPEGKLTPQERANATIAPPFFAQCLDGY